MPELNPIQDRQQWINQTGYEGNFVQPDPGSIPLQALTGAAAGMGVGALAGKNPWSTGWRTGLGALLGNLAGRTFTGDRNMQDTNATVGALLGGGVGMASGLLKKRKKTERSFELPELQLIAKTGGLQDVVNTVRGQLPNIRIPDTVVGGGAGALGGWAYNKLTDDPSLSPAKQKTRKWRNMLAGAGIGAAGGNLVGDRTRRYISNTISPFGYSNNDQTTNMKPSLKKIWEAGVMDRPQQKGVADYLAGKYQPPFQEDYDTLHNSVANAATKRELIRIGAGVNTHTPNSIWSKQLDGSQSINPKHNNASNLVQEFMFPSVKPGRGSTNPTFLNYPMAAISGQNEKPDPEGGLMTSISGGQRIPAYPYAGNYGQDYLAKMQKKFTVQPKGSEIADLETYLKDRFVHHNPQAQLPALNQYEQANTTPKAEMLNLAKRWGFENLVMKQAPSVSQRMYFQQLPGSTTDTRPYYAAIPSTADGETYPGDTVGYFNPGIKQPWRPETGDTDFTSMAKLPELYGKR
jgi:hypothetical protein